ncbi:MAG: hypothetical protein HKN37_13430, partial [Rhodothermales bacterium]|nr:hypothetical protein [Rhodothermales bacterium]
MKLILAASCLLVLGAQSSTAQLAGTYTVGGNSPDFATFQDAADSLLAVGVSGPVDILARPGIYTSPDSAQQVLAITEEIAGASNSSRVRFAPDVASGGNNENIVLRRFAGPRENGFIVALLSSHVTVDGFSIQLSDTSATTGEIPSLVYINLASGTGVRNLLIDGLGRRASRCVWLESIGVDVFASDNRILDCLEGINQSNFGGSGGAADRLMITGNHLSGMSASASRLAPGQYGIHLRPDGGGEDIVVADNVLDYRGGSGITGIHIGGIGKPRLRVERNQVFGLDHNLGFSGFGYILEVSDAPNGLIANNFLSGNAYRSTGVRLNLIQNSDSLTFAHNTVRVGGGGCGALQVNRDSRFRSYVRVLDNILISEGNCANFAYPHMSFSYTTDAEIDYNVHNTIAPWGIVRVETVGNIEDLAAWQDYGFGANSLVQRPEFVDDQSDLHLGECAFEDESLRGIALPLVPIDFDSEGRDPQIPFIGADEPGGGPPDVFGAPSIFAAGKGP